MEILARPQTIDQALYWHLAIMESAINHRSAILAAFPGGALAATRFFGMSYEEIDAFFTEEREEIDAQAIVAIVAAAEATIRIDYFDRVQERYKDSLSLAYKELHRSLSGSSKRPPFDENGILTRMKNCGAIENHLVNDFRNVLRHRHWFAHGRYWALKTSGKSYSPMDVHAVCEMLIGSLLV